MKLTLVVLDGVQALDVAGPLDVFAEANRLLPKQDHYAMTLVGGRADSVVCSSGMHATGSRLPLRHKHGRTRYE